MAAACSGELSTLAPTIGGCPADTELLLFCNVAGQQGGYAFRTWGTVKNCLFSNLQFVPFQFKIGTSGPMNAGDDTLTITQANVIQDSVFITLDGTELPRDDDSQISYGLTYNPNLNNFVVVFNNPVSNGQTYLVHYCYIN